MAIEPFAEARKLGYEWRDASTLGLFAFFICMGGALLLTGFLLVWLFGFMARTSQPVPAINRPFSNAQPLREVPLLQPQPALDHQEYMKSQQQILQNHGWIDRRNGVVRISIDDAMKLLLTRGLPTRPAPGPAILKKSGGADTASSRRSRQEEQR